MEWFINIGLKMHMTARLAIYPCLLCNNVYIPAGFHVVRTQSFAQLTSFSSPYSDHQLIN